MKRLVSVSILLSILSLPLLALAQDEEAGDACLQAQLDAQSKVNGTIWLGAGCLFGLLGVGAAYLITPTPSAVALLGKSPDYVAVYTDCYADEGRSIQTKNAWLGCLLGGAAEALVYTLYVLLIVTASY